MLLTREKANYALILIIIFSVSIRFICIDNPIADEHAWRQTNRAMIARNFSNNGMNFLYPQVDWAGKSSGYAQTEFPIYPYAVALLYKLFGVNEYLGRLISIFFFTITLLFIYKLTRKLWNQEIALLASFSFSILPLNLFFTRAFIPEPMLSFFTTCSIFYSIMWSEKEKNRYFLFSAVAASLALLIKLMAAVYLAIPLAYIWYRKRRLLSSKAVIFSIIVLVPNILWYLHSYWTYKWSGITIFGSEGSGTWRFADIHILIDPRFYLTIFEMFLNALTPLGLLLFAGGIFLRKEKPEQGYIKAWMVGMFVFIIMFARGSMKHNYYQVPLMVPASIMIGAFIYYSAGWISVFFQKTGKYERFRTAFVAVILFFFCCLVPVYVKNYYRLHSEQTLKAGMITQRIAQRDSLVAFVNDKPRWVQFTYYCERKTVHHSLSKLNKKWIKHNSDNGTAFLVMSFEKKENNSKNFLKVSPIGKFLAAKYLISYQDTKIIIFKL
ncbi:MAG: glycosyltransferase family 39 protein [Candidatus Schekmanbacteria bacterium]|nr:glycosyltransferase family 39 protein [Candidatus Schekmanbacteria bacterium]